MSNFSPDGYWLIVPNYDGESRLDHCSVTGMRLREGEEVGVFRPIKGHVEFEGYYDISQYAIEQAARMLGWASPQEMAVLEESNERLRENEMAVKDAFKKAADAVKMAGVRAARADA